ncbi:MAG: exosortase/archaeosortase family protein [Anaerolineae bacterium]
MKAIAAASAVAALVAILFAATLRWLALSWLGNDYYSHGVLVPLVALWLIWRRRDALAAARPTPAALAVVAVGVGLHLVALPMQLAVVSAAALIVVIVGLVWTFAGPAVVRAWAFPMLFLAAMIPLPGIERFSPQLEALTATWAARGAQLLGVAAVNLGGQVAVNDQAFTVGAPCSGLRSVVALGTLAVLFAYSVRGPWWGRALIVASALPIALAANLARVSSIFWVAQALGGDAALGFFHTLASPLLFLVALALLVLLGRAVRCGGLRPEAW